MAEVETPKPKVETVPRGPKPETKAHAADAETVGVMGGGQAMKQQTKIHKPNRYEPWKPEKPLICEDYPEQPPVYCKCGARLSNANRNAGRCFVCQSAELDKKVAAGTLKRRGAR